MVLNRQDKDYLQIKKNGQIKPTADKAPKASWILQNRERRQQRRRHATVAALPAKVGRGGPGLYFDNFPPI